MKKLIRWCPVCDAYSLGAKCDNCEGATINPHPARYSPQDRYGSYRRALKRQQQEEAGGEEETGPSSVPE